MLTFTNQAALSYRNRVRYSNLTTGQIADALTVSKEALTDTYEPGGDVTYVVTLTNNGTVRSSADVALPGTVVNNGTFVTSGTFAIAPGASFTGGTVNNTGTIISNGDFSPDSYNGVVIRN